MAAELLPVPASAPATPAPFVKWVGGKGRLLAQLTALFPKDFERYHEPFVGGGAVFFSLSPDSARISDQNHRLIDTYGVIRDQPSALFDRLETHQRHHCREHFLAARERVNDPIGLADVDRAALFIYLNKTCFNGLWRENSRGRFNAPIGRYANPRVFDPERLLAVSRALQGVDIECAPYTSVLDHAESGDFVYLDPPYYPVSATARFTSYGPAAFGEAQQIELARTFATLARRGCYVMLSNSDCGPVRALYRGWRVAQVSRTGTMNSKADRRSAPVAEVVVRSW